MAKLMYKGEHEIKGTITKEINDIVEVTLDNGGTMMLPKVDVIEVKSNTSKKEAKKEYKKEHNENTESEG